MINLEILEKVEGARSQYGASHHFVRCIKTTERLLNKEGLNLGQNHFLWWRFFIIEHSNGC
jgi:hypothetical protein